MGGPSRQLLAEPPRLERRQPTLIHQRRELVSQGGLARLLGLELGEQGIHAVTPRDSLDEPLLARLDERQLSLDGGSPVKIGLLPSPEAVQRAVDRRFDHALVEDVGQRLKHGLVKKVLSDLETVRADGVPSLVVVGAPVEARFRPLPWARVIAISSPW